MPLDSMRNVAESLAACGVKVVPPMDVALHKRDEVRKHPASPLFYMAHLFSVVFAVCLTSLFVSMATLPMWFMRAHVFLSLSVLILPIVILTGWAFAAIAAGNKRVLGPATWVSGTFYEYMAPAEIRRRASLVRTLFPSASVSFRQETLYQERLSLDPILFVKIGGEEFCIGIWDGMTVIA